MQVESRFMIRLSSGEEFGPADVTTIGQWAREGRVASDALLVPTAGGEAVSVLSRPELARILHAPPLVRAPVAQDTGDETIATLIPYRNAPALTGYYISIGSLFPLLGAIAGPVAVYLGIAGLRKRKADPRVHGTAHAWIAIILGGIGTLISIGCIGSIIIAVLADGTLLHP